MYICRLCQIIPALHDLNPKCSIFEGKFSNLQTDAGLWAFTSEKSSGDVPTYAFAESDVGDVTLLRDWFVHDGQSLVESPMQLSKEKPLPLWPEGAPPLAG